MHKRQCICQGSAFSCILLCSFVQLRLCVLGASVGMTVQSAVFRCPRARGSLVFVVAPFCIRASFLACSSYTTRGLPVYGQVAVGTFQWSKPLLMRSSVVVGCRWKWAIEGSGLGHHEPFSPCHLGPEVLRMSVRAHGWFVRFSQPSVQSPSWNWLSIVEAPGCLGHPTST